MVGARRRERDGLTLQQPRVSSRRARQHVASNLLLMMLLMLLRGSLQHHRGGVVVVHGWVVAAVRSRSAAVAVRLLRQGHVTELGVEGVRLERERFESLNLFRT